MMDDPTALYAYYRSDVVPETVLLPINEAEFYQAMREAEQAYEASQKMEQAIRAAYSSQGISIAADGLKPPTP